MSSVCAKPSLLITRRLPDAVLRRAARHFDLRVWPENRPIGDALDSWVKGCAAVLVMANDRIDRDQFERLGIDLRAIATYSVGLDHIDLEAATARGLPVFNTPDVLSDAVAEAAMFLLLAAARDATAAERVLREGQWGPWSPTAFMGRQLTGRTLGIYGMGRIGRAVAKRARGFGLAIHYHNRSELVPLESESGMVYHPTLDALMRISDALVVCAPSTPQTRGSINAARLAMLPAGALFVNVARGDLVVEKSLIDALRSGQVGAAGLDVYLNEPQIDKHWLTLPRTTLLPHIGSATHEAREAMGFAALDALELWLVQGRSPTHCANPAALRAGHRESPYGDLSR